MDASDKKVIDDIKEYGWHVVKVFDSENIEPDFAYSIGLYEKYKHPEIFIIGLTLKNMHHFINHVGEEIAAGRTFTQGVTYNEFANDYENRFLVVDQSHYKDYFGLAIHYYKGEEFPVLQFVWQDKGHHFPWEDEYAQELKKIQPMLNNPKQ